MSNSIIVMSNSKGSPVIALPAYNSLDRILKLSFLMTQAVGNLRLGCKRNRPNFSLRVYLNFARHFSVITNNTIIQLLTIQFLFEAYNSFNIFTGSI